MGDKADVKVTEQEYVKVEAEQLQEDMNIDVEHNEESNLVNDFQSKAEDFSTSRNGTGLHIPQLTQIPKAHTPVNYQIHSDEPLSLVKYDKTKRQDEDGQLYQQMSKDQNQSVLITSPQEHESGGAPRLGDSPYSPSKFSLRGC